MSKSFDFDQLATEIAFATPGKKRECAFQAIQDLRAYGVYPATIGPWYRAIAARMLPWMTIPAFNLRGNTYQVARRVWRVAQDLEVGAIIFELAPTEAAVSEQTFAEYTALVLAAAAREGYRGPVFLQGDHFDIPTDGDLEAVKKHCQEAIQAGMYHIDVDGCHLVSADQNSRTAYHRPNAAATAEVIQFIRGLQPPDTEIMIGGEVGVIGGDNTTPEDLRAFLTSVQTELLANILGLEKISAQTGTKHGGNVNPDGSVGRMQLDLELANQLSAIARSEFGLAGLVQHGASTLQIDELAQLKAQGIIEVHLATGIQNIIFDHPDFPEKLRDRIQADLVQLETGPEGTTTASDDQTPAQLFYNARWAAWGPYKAELWNLPETAWSKICIDLDKWLGQVFQALGVTGQWKNLANYYPIERTDK